TRSYTLPGSASPGQNILETRIIRSGFSDLVERQYMDGLSRVYRSESPAKQTQTVIVDRSFDARGRPLTESLPYFTGGGVLRTFSYDALGRPTVVLDPDSVTQRVLGYSTPWTVVEETYFGAATPGNRKQRTERTADGLGRLVRVAQFEDAVAAATPYLITAKYDAADRLYEVRDPIANNGALCTSLNMGAQCATQDHVTEITWDTFGRRVKIDDADSGVWTYKYDDAGLVKERTQNGGTGSARSQLFAYDQLERPTAKTFTPTGNGVANATFVYENNDANVDFAQLIQVNATGGTTYLYGYDAAGRRDTVIQRTASKEFGSVYEYDELDRVTGRLFPDGDSFDYQYDGIRLLNIRADTANPAFKGTVLKFADYDALGRMKYVEIGQGAGSAALATNTYVYDTVNARLTRVTGTAGNLVSNDPDGDRITPASSDKCPNAYNPDQLDGGGLGSASVPDGIGNACQCGDVDGSGKVTSADATAIGAFIASGTALAKADLCDVTGDGLCLSADQTAVSAAASSGTGNLQNCLPSKTANLPSSAPLDLVVNFDGLGRLTSQTGSLGSESVNRSYSYDGLSRLKTAIGPWEKGTGATGAVTWTYTYDALGNLRQQASNRTPSNLADNRTWSYTHATKPHYLSTFAQQGQSTETLAATLGGEVAIVTKSGSPTAVLTWNAQGKLYRYKDSTYSYDVYDDATLTVTGPSGSSTSIVSVGDDFEYDIGAQRANKFFTLDGVRIASLATSYVAPTAAVPPVLRIVLRYSAPLAAPAAAALVALGLLSLASLTLRRHTPVWLSVPGVGVLSFALIALPYTAQAATLTSGPGKYGRHAEPILAYLVDHLGTIRGAVNQDGIVVETRDYAPFGESIAHAGAFSVEHRFTGQPQDDQAGGLYNYGARFYNPKWGRFVSPDEMVQGFDSQGLNPFAYVLNGPTSAIDPTGELFDLPIFSFGTLAGLPSGVGGMNGDPSAAPSGSNGGGPGELVCDDYGSCVLGPSDPQPFGFKELASTAIAIGMLDGPQPGPVDLGVWISIGMGSGLAWMIHHATGGGKEGTDEQTDAQRDADQEADIEAAQAAKRKVGKGEEIGDISKSKQRAQSRRDRIRTLEEALKDFGDE
ncbi:MAG: RHS repeat-associated core domain-containing protein, partial [Mycobacterium sp.]